MAKSAAPFRSAADSAAYWAAMQARQPHPIASQLPESYKSRFDAPAAYGSTPSAYPHLSGSAVSGYQADSKQSSGFEGRSSEFPSGSRAEFGAARPDYPPRPEYGSPGEYRGSFRGGPRGGGRGDFRGGRGEFRGSFRGSRGDFNGASRGGAFRGAREGSAPERGSFRGSFRGGDRGSFRGSRGDFRGGRGDFRGGRGDFRGAPRGRGGPFGSAGRPDSQVSRFDQSDRGADRYREEHNMSAPRDNRSSSNSSRSRSRSPPQRPGEDAMRHAPPRRGDYRFGSAPAGAGGPSRTGARPPGNNYPPSSRDGYNSMYGQVPPGAPASAEMYAAMMQAYQQYGSGYPAAPPAYAGYSGASAYPSAAGHSAMGPYGPSGSGPAGAKRSYDRDEYRGPPADSKRLRT